MGGGWSEMEKGASEAARYVVKKSRKVMWSQKDYSVRRNPKLRR